MAFIALLSDLGYNDTGVAKAKSSLLQQIPDATLVDVTHNMQPYYVPQAAYLLASCIYDFPPGSSIIVLFDIYYASSPRLVLAEVEGRYVFAPDNGTIPLAFPLSSENRLVHEAGEGDNLGTWVKAISNCISSIDANAGSIAYLQQYEMQNAPLQFKPITTSASIEAHVIHIDRFENIVLNVRKSDFDTVANGRNFSISVLRDEPITEISKQYNSVQNGEKLCRFNSAGYLEIAINKGKAASLFGLRVKLPEQLMYNSIKINFE